jgi:RNA polymerase sigma-70 factor, ECF subfamily
MSDASTPITALLARWSEGEPEALHALMALAYDDLRAIAHRRLLAAGSGETLATTALVHEAFLRLDGRKGDTWESRAHFYAFASRAMRHIIVDHARSRQAAKRSADLRLPLEDAEGVVPDAAADVLGVDEALERLASRHPRMGRVVELRFFGGLSVPETAQVLGTSIRTVEREWTRARVYLAETLRASQRA